MSRSPRAQTPDRPFRAGRSRHLLHGVIGLFVALSLVIGWLALDTVSRLDRSADTSTNFAAAELAISDLYNATAEIITMAIEAARTDTDDADERTEAARVLRAAIAPWLDMAPHLDDLASRLDALAPGDLRTDDALERLAWAIEDMTGTSEALADTLLAGDRLAVDRLADQVLTQYRVVRLRLEQTEQVAFAAEVDGLDDLTSGADARLGQIMVAFAAVAVATCAVVVVAGRGHRRERELDRTVRAEKRQLQAIVDCLPVSLVWKGRDGRVIGANTECRRVVGALGIERVEGAQFSDITGRDDIAAEMSALAGLEAEVMAVGTPRAREAEVTFEGERRELRHIVSPVVLEDGSTGVVTVTEDVTDARRMRRALESAGRMESIGQLAAGVAHEINTPVQYVSDNTTFLTASFGEVMGAVDQLADICRGHDGAALDRVLDHADMAFLREEIPSALAQSQEGLGRVTEIVRAMKDFSHPSLEIAETDLNRIIRSTVAVSRSEWKNIAEVQLDLDPDLPLVGCSAAQIKQVLLNMVVNAGHAIADAGLGRQGTITVVSRACDDGVTIDICDDGVGIPEGVRERIFEQFFTTKEPGRGTGQGLSLAYDVVSAHGGTIEVRSTAGVGTTFVVNLPTTPTAGRERPAEGPAAPQVHTAGH